MIINVPGINVNQGWTCPGCKRCYSPHVSLCMYCPAPTYTTPNTIPLPNGWGSTTTINCNSNPSPNTSFPGVLYTGTQMLTEPAPPVSYTSLDTVSKKDGT